MITSSQAVPGAPTAVTATAGNTSATVRWTAPTYAGATEITGYKVTASPGGQTTTVTGTSATVTGLTNGTAYRFTVVTINGVGNSAAGTSGTVTPVEPTTLTLASSGTSVFHGTRVTLSGRLTGSEGRALGGLPVQLWWRSPTGTTWATGAYATTAADGTWSYAYTSTGSLVYQATAAAGGGRAKAASPTVTITSSQAVPNAATGVTATAGDRQATVRWTAPTYVGAGAITGYRVTASPGGQTTTVTGTSATVTGLTNGTAYRFTVVTINASGSGAGATSGAVTPVEVPTVTLVPSAMSVQAGAGVTVSGRLTGSGGRALGGVLVTVLYRPNASTPWSGVAGYTAADGTYSFPVTASQTRTYVATVSAVTGVRASAASPEVVVTAS